MTHLRFHPTALLALIVAVFSGMAAKPARAAAPNILLLFADDLGYEALGSYGGLDFKTPRLDSFARESVRFSRAYTSAVCTPSRMSYYTGRYTVNHGYWGVLPVHRGTRQAVDFQSLPTVAQALRRAGYATSVTGKWQLATLEFHPDHIDSAGFESWCVWQIWRHGAKTTRYWNPCFNHDGKVREDIADRFGPDVLADYVIDRMKRAVAEKRPFYIHHNMLLPHWPILETPNEKQSGQSASLGNMITYMDGLVGRILAAVDDLGIADNTWVIFMGDNGTDSKQPRRTHAGDVRLGKHHLSEAGTHIPLLVRGPGKTKPGSVVTDLVDIADFFPTLCELAGAETPDDARLDGISFAPRLLGKTEEPHRRFVTAGLSKDYFVFDGNWRLHAKNNALYDCRELPSEKKVTMESPDSARARQRLQPILNSIKR